MQTFFWVSAITIVVLQYFHHTFLGDGDLKKAYPLAIVIYAFYAIVETTLALTQPNQMGVLVFNLVNGWAMYNAIKGLLRLAKENQMTWATPYIQKLKTENMVSFRPKGNSMVPLIHSGELVTVQKFDNSNENWKNLKRGDIVLCKVKGKQYLHLVLTVSTHQQRVQIGNNKGHVNGWTGTIYGKVIKVEN